MATKSDPLAMLRADRDTRFPLADQESALRRFLTAIGASSWKASHGLTGWQSKMATNLHETPAYNLFNRPWVFRGNRFGPVMTLHPNVHYPNFDGLENIIGYLASRPSPTDVYVIPEGSWERTGRTVLVMLPSGFAKYTYSSPSLKTAGWVEIPSKFSRYDVSPRAAGPIHANEGRRD